MEKIKVGVVGCGTISGIYLKNLTETFKNLEVLACADIDIGKAREKAQEFGVLKAYSLDDMLSDTEIEIVLNLTIPKVHAEICLAAIEAGKNVHVEKPLAITREEGKKILCAAKEKGLLIGCAPDTFMGGGIQTCRKLIDDGWIGEPIGASAFMQTHGVEQWHPNPEFYYKVGGGPMFDMGPYYLTALVSLMGPVKRVCGSARASFAERTITSLPKAGAKIMVDVPTHISGVLDFESGAIGTINTSFDVWAHQLPRIEIYGSEGTLSVPDPNTFGGPVLIRRHRQTEWSEVPLIYGYTENSRGLGVVDMAYALQNKRVNRANGELGYHVLDIMHGIHDASREGQYCLIESTCNRPQPLQLGITEEEILS